MKTLNQKNQQIEKPSLEYYLNLQYPVILYPDPEIYYLKAQILKELGQKEKSQQMIQEAIANFDKALTKKSQLPGDLVKQIEGERKNAVSLKNPG